jgi:hypothetical protein
MRGCLSFLWSESLLWRDLFFWWPGQSLIEDEERQWMLKPFNSDLLNLVPFIGPVCVGAIFHPWDVHLRRIANGSVIGI